MSLFGDKREDTRAVFFSAWHKHRNGEALEGIEKLIINVARHHPEYHSVLADPERYTDHDYSPEHGEINPFLHMGMHITIEEQLMIDQPHGIRDRYQKLLSAIQDEHAVQHGMMECLAEMLWQASQNRSAPDESVYLSCLDRKI